MSTDTGGHCLHPVVVTLELTCSHVQRLRMQREVDNVLTVGHLTRERDESGCLKVIKGREKIRKGQSLRAGRVQQPQNRAVVVQTVAIVQPRHCWTR